jgi:hypothetical protein
MQIAGWDIRCPRGYPGHLVSNPGSETRGKGRKEGNPHKGIDWPTRKTSGQAGLGRKEGGGRASTPSGQQKTPQG